MQKGVLLAICRVEVKVSTHQPHDHSRISRASCLRHSHADANRRRQETDRGTAIFAAPPVGVCIQRLLATRSPPSLRAH